ncbi:GBF-interacting protein 1-like isoform X2 [Diospyros lotus]|uniref:GBF-interacting protein 1-like isoform X2 n=1 Tax=Diospyros lotus TaxID=55363 RepID=UPI0022527498|nr:GBF-interacting protein 1-like isoform X2 [Diospyros lotus]
MSSGGGSRVPIPGDIRRVIRDIKEIAARHSDDDVYAMLQECNMDPDETAQRLLYLDTFHEVKKKRDRRIMDVKSKDTEEYRLMRGTHGGGVRGGQGNYSSSYISHRGGGGRNKGAQKENGVGDSMKRGSKTDSLTAPAETEKSMDLLGTSSSKVAVNGVASLPNTHASHESGLKLSADSVVVPPYNPQIPGVETIRKEVNGQRIAAESCASNLSRISNTAHDVVSNFKTASGDVAFTEKVPIELQMVEKNQTSEESQSSSVTTRHGYLEVISVQNGQSSRELTGPSRVASVVITKKVEAGSQSIHEQNDVIDEANSKLDMKLAKLNISSHRPVIFPDHLQVPEDIKNGLIFGSLFATSEVGVKRVEETDDRKGSVPAIDLLQENDKAVSETPLSNPSVSSTAQEVDSPDNPHSLLHAPGKLSNLEENVSLGPAPTFDHPKQETLFPRGGPQYPFVHTNLDYSFPLVQPMLGSRIVQCQGTEPQSGNSLVSSTSGSMTTSNRPLGVGLSSTAASPPPFPVLRQPYPPYYLPISPYFPPFYFPPNAHQFLGHSGFLQQPLTGNAYLSPVLPQGKPGISSGNPTQLGVPFSCGSYGPSLPVISGSSGGNEDRVASELKQSSIRPTFQQAGYIPFPGIYHPSQTTVSPQTNRPLLQQSPAAAGSIKTAGPQPGAYQLPQHAANRNSG